MDQPPAVAFTAFADVWPRATETEMGAALCAIGAVGTLTLTFESDIWAGWYYGLRECNFNFNQVPESLIK